MRRVEMQMQLVSVQQAGWLPLIAGIVLTSQVELHSFPSVALFSRDFQRFRPRVAQNNIENAMKTTQVDPVLEKNLFYQQPDQIRLQMIHKESFIKMYFDR